MCVISRRELVVSLAGLVPGCRLRQRPLTVAALSLRRLVLCEIIAQHVERRLRSQVRRNTDLVDSLLANDALIAGRVDLYAETTGGALTAILQRPPDPRPEVVLERLRLEYGQRYRVEWFDPLGFEDGFVMVVRREQARAWRLETLSDAARLSNGWQIAAGQEFLTRPDGMPALMKTYGLRLTTGPKVTPPESAYQDLRQGRVNLVAGRAADGELRSADFQVLADDRQGFPPSQVAIVARSETLGRHPGLRQALAELSGRITPAEMRELNAQALAGRPPATVAAEFLARAGLPASARLRVPTQPLQ